MKILALAVGIVLLLLTVTVAAFWWVARPMFYTGPGRSVARSASGELVELERPGITRRDIVDLLRDREFEVLTRVIETRNQRALADPKEEWELGRVFDAFEIRDDSLGDVFKEWGQASPASFAPLVASAKYRFVMAYVERGERAATDTTPEQFAGMERQLTLLFEDAAAALDYEASSETFVVLIDASRTAGTQIQCGQYAKAGLELMPASFRIRAALAACRLPRWGGAYVRIEQIAKAADPFVTENPDLAALHGIVEWDRGRVAEGRPAIAHFTTALESGAFWRFYADRALEQRRARRHEDALADIDAALELAPDRPDLLVERLYALAGLGRNDEIADIIELVEAIDPMNDDLPGFKTYALKLAAYEANKMGGAASVERVNQGIAIDGGDSTAYLVRGRGHLAAGDERQALADFEAAIRLDPSNFTAHVNIDHVYARRGDWPRVIAMWDAYLENYPDDGKAVFERAGAIRHSGDEILAMQEANRACKMGVAAACAAVRRR